MKITNSSSMKDRASSAMYVEMYNRITIEVIYQHSHERTLCIVLRYVVSRRLYPTNPVYN